MLELFLPSTHWIIASHRLLMPWWRVWLSLENTLRRGSRITAARPHSDLSAPAQEINLLLYLQNPESQQDSVRRLAKHLKQRHVQECARNIQVCVWFLRDYGEKQGNITRLWNRDACVLSGVNESFHSERLHSLKGSSSFRKAELHQKRETSEAFAGLSISSEIVNVITWKMKGVIPDSKNESSVNLPGWDVMISRRKRLISKSQPGFQVQSKSV